MPEPAVPTPVTRVRRRRTVERPRQRPSNGHPAARPARPSCGARSWSTCAGPGRPRPTPSRSRSGPAGAGVAQQLRALDTAGLVTRTSVRHGVGRPRHLYDITADAQDLFPSNYDGLATGLLAAILEVGGEALVEDVFAARRRQAETRLRERHGRALPDRRAARGAGAGARPAPGRAGVHLRGRASTSGGIRLLEHNCAVLDVARGHPGGVPGRAGPVPRGAGRGPRARAPHRRRRPLLRVPRWPAPRRPDGPPRSSPPRAPRPRVGRARGGGGGTSETLGTKEAASDVAAICSCSVEREDPEAAQRRELVADVGLEHLGPVRADRVADAVAVELVEDPAELVPAGHHAGVQVRGGADLEHDPPLAEHRHRARVVGGLHAMPDAVRLQELDDARRSPRPGRTRRCGP